MTKVLVFGTYHYQDAASASIDEAEAALRTAMPTKEVFAGDEQLAFEWTPEAEAAAQATGIPYTVEMYD